MSSDNKLFLVIENARETNVLCGGTVRIIPI
jgi:hypothetical protein